MAQARVSQVSTNFPDPNVQLVNSEGFITEQWRRFLQSIFTRTGSAVGVNAANVVIQVNTNTEVIDGLQAAFVEEIAGIPPPKKVDTLLSLALAEVYVPRLPYGIGAYISNTVLIGSAVSLTSGTPANVTSITLTPGDWDVTGTVAYSSGSTTNITVCIGWTSLVSATSPTQPNNGGICGWTGNAPVSAGPTLSVGSQRIVVTRPTTVFLSTVTNFNTSTLATYGFIGARRSV